MIWRLVPAIVALAGPMDLAPSWNRQEAGPAGPDTGREVHLADVKALTDGGENAEAYFSFDGEDLIFQSTRDGGECDERRRR